MPFRQEQLWQISSEDLYGNLTCVPKARERGGGPIQNRTAGQKISVVTVTYNSSSVLPAMLDSIPGDVPVIVVDNASEDAAKNQRHRRR